MHDEVIISPHASAQKLADLKQLTLIIYVLYTVAPLTAGLSAVVAVVINHLKRDDVRGTLYESHFAWQIRLFWRTAALILVGYLTVWVYYLGLVVLLGGLLWYVYGLVKGFAYLRENRDLPLRDRQSPAEATSAPTP